MTVSNHMLNLRKKYDEINQLIHDELCRPLPDTIHLFDLKLKRLRLKEKLFALT